MCIAKQPFGAIGIAPFACLAEHVDYIHYNPVKHGWVARAADWPHSTLHEYIKRGMVNRDWDGPFEYEEGGYGER